MKRTLLLLAATFALAGCGHKVPEGVVRCSQISVSGLVSYNIVHAKGASAVYEYKASDGGTIYFSQQLYSNYSLTVQANAYDSSNAKIYTYNKLIGYLLTETNIYYDTAKRVIDLEQKYSKFTYQYDFNTNEDIDNALAFKCAKKGYYTTTSTSDGNTKYYIYTDFVETSLTRHAYLDAGETSVVSYTKL